MTRSYTLALAAAVDVDLGDQGTRSRSCWPCRCRSRSRSVPVPAPQRASMAKVIIGGQTLCLLLTLLLTPVAYSLFDHLGHARLWVRMRDAVAALRARLHPARNDGARA